ncbi:interleukin-3 [Peromyscus maniculatus bairdii]|uniref:interleukin-3 n=1 Tax=Peromyscus maniculatus bairdii TaxID=230844 RepID=UPI003FD2C4ED
MVLASSTTTRVLSMLLLLTMLFHGALQIPVSPSAPSGTASTMSCSSIAKEIMKKLNASRLDDVDARDQLRLSHSPAFTSPARPRSSYMEDSLPSQNNDSQRANLCEFLKMRNQLNIKDIKTNLENLERCLPVVNTSNKTGIFLENNPDDFQTKLKYYVSQLKNLQLTPRPTSDSAFCPESKE